MLLYPIAGRLNPLRRHTVCLSIYVTCLLELLTAVERGDDQLLAWRPRSRSLRHESLSNALLLLMLLMLVGEGLLGIMLECLRLGRLLLC